MSLGEKGSTEKQRIDSWKDIAAFFGRDERTVKRWEQSRSLPVYRVPGAGKSGVFAYAEELREWLHSSQQEKANAEIDGPPPVAAAEPGTPNGQGSAFRIGDPPADPGPDENTKNKDALRPPAGPILESVAHPLPTQPAINRGPVLEMRRTGAAPSIPPGDRDSQGLPDSRVRQGTIRDRRVPSNLDASDGKRTGGFEAAVWAAVCFLAAASIFFVVRHSVHGRVALTGFSQKSPAKHATDPQAREFYLEGRYYWNRRTADSLNQAVDAFTQAIVHDPSDAEAYAGLADTYDLMREYASMPSSEAYPRAIAAASKAVALDDSLSEAHRALAFGLFYGNWEIPRALGEYRRAIQLDPKDVEAHHWYATSLMALGRDKEAMAELEVARELDPGSKSIVADRDLLVSADGEPAKAIADLTQLERAEPGFLSPPRYLATIYLQQGNYPAFLAENSKAAALSKDPQQIDSAQAAAQSFARGGKRGMLQEMLRMQKKAFEDGNSTGFDAAYTSALLGDGAGAVPYLQHAVAARDERVFGLERSVFQPMLKSDPRFIELEAQIQSAIRGASVRISNAGGH